MSVSFYVYEHWRPDKGVCFYVGKGFGNRAYRLTKNRNKHHQNVVNKLFTMGVEVDVRIIAQNLTEESALSLEIERIVYWENKGVILTNITRGGEGVSGLKHTKETKEFLRQNSLAVMPEVMNRPEIRRKLKQSITARMADPKNRLIVSDAMKVVMRDPAARKSRSDSMKKIMLSAATREARSKSMKTLYECEARREKAKKNGEEIGSRLEVKEARRLKTVQNWKNPEILEKRRRAISEAMKRPEVVARKSEIMRARMADPVYSEKMRQAAISRHQENRVKRADESVSS